MNTPAPIRLTSQRTILKILFTALIILTFGSVTFANQEIEPARKITGKIADPALKAYRPESGIISDTTTWRKLWGAWRPNEPLADVDFKTQIVLVETVEGPNTAFASLLELSENGHLTYEVASTRMAGPGFGYLILLIPKQNILTVNGKPVAKPRPDLAGAKPGVDPKTVGLESVRVEIVGRVRTGIFSIGGETTGTLIAANGIIWELDLQNDEQLVEAVRSLGTSLAEVRGTLAKNPGVEVRERWIVTVESLAKLGQNPVNRAAENSPDKPVGQPRPAQSADPPITRARLPNSFQLISISTSGGIAGVGASQTIAPDGTVKYEDKRQNFSDTWSIEPATLAKLHQFVAGTDWDSVPKVTRAENVADAFNFAISIETPKGVTRIFIDGPSIASQPMVQELFAIIRRPPANPK